MKRTPAIAVLLAALVSVLLVSAALVIHRTVTQGSSLVVRGLADALSLAANEAFRGRGALPTSEQLQEFLSANESLGLRYIAVTNETGRALAASAGMTKASVDEEDGLQTGDVRARFVQPLRLWRRGEKPPAFDLQRGPGRYRLIIEFEPVAALELRRKSRALVFITMGTSLGIMALAVAFARIVKQREALQVELERGRRLAALGTMSTVLAHELKNPLASLKGHAQLLSESVEKDAALHAKSERVVSEAVRLEQLLNDLLLFVKGGEVDRKPTDAAELLRSAAALVGQVKVETPPNVVTAQLDRERMSLALQNVLRNAVQAGGEVEASLEQDGAGIRYVVRDRGPGLPPGDEEKIFEPFVTTKTRGIGLGLAITRRIIEQHKGTITGKNREGGGAEFVIRVPGA